VNVVDSSAFLEYFTGGPNAERFAKAIGDTASLIVPVITIYEVFRKISREHTTERALEFIAEMQHGRVVDVDVELALDASRLSQQHHLAMADALIYATAHQNGASLWTQDAHFKDLPNVRYFPKSA
jgi:toxin FitB